VSESDVVRLTRRTFKIKELGTGTVLIFLTTPLFVGLFRLILELESEWSLLAAYAVLFLWGITVILLAVLFVWGSVDFLPWPKRASASGSDTKTGWQIRTIPYQGVMGFAVMAIPIFILGIILKPRLSVPAWDIGLQQIVLVWLVIAPVETWLQAWTWPMIYPFGPITAQVAFVLLHGARALDPVFFAYAFLMGLAFWGLSYIRYRYAGRRVARWFGPITAWSAHATLNTLLFFVALGWPSLSFLRSLFGW
jgi:hypothetical protein